MTFMQPESVMLPAPTFIILMPMYLITMEGKLLDCPIFTCILNCIINSLLFIRSAPLSRYNSSQVVRCYSKCQTHKVS